MGADGGSTDPRATRPAFPRPQLSGRRRELRAAREALHTAGAVLLTGPPGVGLTAVATALAAEAADSGATVLRCAPTRAERGLPGAGLGDLLTGLPPERLGALLAGLAEPAGSALRAALLHDLLPTAGVDRLALGLGLLELLRALAADGGLLLLVDGLPWLDGPSAAALGFALRRTDASEGVRLLATARDDAADGVGVGVGVGDGDGDGAGERGGDADSPAPGHWWELCPPGTVELRLPPLPPTAVAELLARDLGGPLPVALLRDVQQVAAGNPRHALDLARAGFRLGPTGPHGVPRGLRAEVLDRMRPLAAAERQLLLLAAVATRPSLAELGSALGRLGGSPRPNSSACPGGDLLRLLEAPLRLGLLELLDEPRDDADVLGERPTAGAAGPAGPLAELLRPAEPRSGELDFREPVVRMVLLEQAAPAELAAARSAFAAVIADPVERARLTALADPTADLGSLGAAAREAARDRDAPALAYELALLAVRQAPLAPPPGPPTAPLWPLPQRGLVAVGGDAEACLPAAARTADPARGIGPRLPSGDPELWPRARACGAFAADQAPDRFEHRRVGQLVAAAEYGVQSGHWLQARALALQVLAAGEPSGARVPQSGSHAVHRRTPPTDGLLAAHLALRTRARVVLLRAAGQGLAGLGEVIDAGLAELPATSRLPSHPVAAAPRPAPTATLAPVSPHSYGGTEAAGFSWARSELLRWSAERQLLTGAADQAHTAAAAALAAARAVPPSVAGSAAEQQVAALRVFALALAGCGELTGARHALDEAAVLLRNVEPRPARRELRHRLLDAELSVERPAQLRTALTVLPAETTPVPALPEALIPRCAAYARLGDGASAMAAAVQLQEVLAVRGEPLAGPPGVGAGAPAPTHGLALHAVALAELVGGSAERAGELARRAAAGWAALGDRWHQVRALGVLGESGLLRGEPAATAAGVEVLQEAHRLSVAAGFADPGAVRRLALLAEGLVALGEHAAAARVLGRGEELTGRWESAAAPARAALDRATALVQAGVGNGREAVALLRGAAERQRAAGLPLEVARTLVALGSVERRLRHRPGARAALLEAREICADLRALPLLARVARESERVDQPIAPPGVDGGLLTASEQRMAGLAAEGATNREVAAALFVSVKTVEGTLSRVYRKLGVRSRAALARALAGAD